MSTPDIRPDPGVTAVTLAEILATPAFAGAEVLAGADGLDRPVERLTVMEVPDIQRWAKPREFLLTSAYPIRDQLENLGTLVTDLDDSGLAGIGIKLGRYLDVLPADVAEIADARSFPIIQLPPGVTFDDLLTEAFTVILDRHAEKLARAERIHRAFLQTVLRGEGLPEIVRDLAELLDTPVAIVSPRGQVLASQRLHQLGIAETVELELDVEARLVRSGDRELACEVVPISAGKNQHGYVVALVQHRAPDDLIALESAATVAALALTKEREVHAVESKYRSDLMHDLLRGADDHVDMRRRAAAFGWDIDRGSTVFVVRRDSRAGVTPVEHTYPPAPGGTLHRLVADRDPAAAVVHFSHEVVILTVAFPADARNEAIALARRLQREVARSEKASVSVGISRPIDEIAEIPRGYTQAVRALNVGRRVVGEGAVRHFDALGAYRLLSLVEDDAELRTFASEALGELDRDTAGSEDLRQTLQVWLDTGGNVAETSRRLHFHYHSIRYRLAKLEGMLGPFMTDGQLRLDLQLALLVRSMRGLDT
ncbi:MAG: PucR family transcriptional regulator ligand-binding domain-containing protein [Nitriliruptoraceae bacterium]